VGLDDIFTGADDGAETGEGAIGEVTGAFVGLEVFFTGCSVGAETGCLVGIEVMLTGAAVGGT